MIYIMFNYKKENLKTYKNTKGIENLSEEAKAVLRDTIPKTESDGLKEIIINKEYLEKLFGDRAKAIDFLRLGNELSNVNFKVYNRKNGNLYLFWLFLKFSRHNDEYSLLFSDKVTDDKFIRSMIFKNIDQNLSDTDIDNIEKHQRENRETGFDIKISFD